MHGRTLVKKEYKIMGLWGWEGIYAFVNCDSEIKTSTYINYTNTPSPVGSGYGRSGGGGGDW